ncbi:1247_t:CDS:1, partial [Dentiscutata erythropus]
KRVEPPFVGSSRSLILCSLATAARQIVKSDNLSVVSNQTRNAASSSLDAGYGL